MRLYHDQQLIGEASRQQTASNLEPDMGMLTDGTPNMSLYTGVAAICLFISLVVTLLGIKIWWFKHRLSFDQNNSNMRNGGANSGAQPGIGMRRNREKRMSQIGDSVVVHGVFRKRLEDETETIAECNSQLPPIRIQPDLSQSTPNLLVPPPRTKRQIRPPAQPTTSQENIDWSKWPMPTRQPPSPPVAHNTTTTTTTKSPAIAHPPDFTTTPIRVKGEATTPTDINGITFQTFAVTHTQPTDSVIRCEFDSQQTEVPTSPPPPLPSQLQLPPQPMRRLVKSSSASILQTTSTQPALAMDVNGGQADFIATIETVEMEDVDMKAGFEHNNSPLHGEREYEPGLTCHEKLMARRPTGYLRPAAELMIEEMRNSATVLGIYEPGTPTEQSYIVEFSEDDNKDKDEGKGKESSTKRQQSVEIEETDVDVNECDQDATISLGEEDSPDEELSNRWHTVDLGSSDVQNLGKYESEEYRTRHDYHTNNAKGETHERERRCVKFQIDADEEETLDISAPHKIERRATGYVRYTDELFQQIEDEHQMNGTRASNEEPKEIERRPTGYERFTESMLRDLEADIAIESGGKQECHGTAENAKTYTWLEIEQQIDTQSANDADEEFKRIEETHNDCVSRSETNQINTKEQPKGFGKSIEDDWDSFDELNVVDEEHEFDSLLCDESHHNKRHRNVRFDNESIKQVDDEMTTDFSDPVSILRNERRPTAYVRNFDELYAELESSGNQTTEAWMENEEQNERTNGMPTKKPIATTSILKEHVRDYRNSNPVSGTRKLKPRQKVTFDFNTEEYYLPSNELDDNSDFDNADDDDDEPFVFSRSLTPPKVPPPPLPTPMQRTTNIQYTLDDCDAGEQYYDADDSDEVAAELKAKQQAALLFSTQISLAEAVSQNENDNQNESFDSWSAIRQHRSLTEELQQNATQNSGTASGRPQAKTRHLPPRTTHPTTTTTSTPPTTPPLSPAPPRPAYRNPLTQAAAAALAEIQPTAMGANSAITAISNSKRANYQDDYTSKATTTRTTTASAVYYQESLQQQYNHTERNVTEA